MVCTLLSEEMIQTGNMYLEYPEGYNQGVADTNNRIYDNFVRLQFRHEVSPEVGRILIDSGLAQTMSRTYYCARAELVCRRGSRVDARDAYVIICRVVRKWRQEFGRMDPALVGNEDLAEIMWNIQLDGDEESEFERWE